ncbi:conserved hypothetical protein [Methanosalsum zhilinae DSM 4017]|uniref:DUF5611 domain-containing protein n=1 Tax=Methanosalsum zhilinae (strain DSM 4017 / NBRC 107636 / OCM 62 / WeN5) TaxID=679901 RepID=F7XPH8_METZD|nr:DUF5611 family protein [Methanosalsum zhilinae]AEH61403.1 conserved hypothetical protein [Methanosalsum zhilinae DSM 4017]
MQSYKLKRGYSPDIDRIHSVLEENFPEIERTDDRLVTSYGAISKMEVWIENKKLVVDTVSDTDVTDENLILDTNKRFRQFLDDATGYSAKERVKQAKKEVTK